MKLKNKSKEFLKWYDENIHDLFMMYGEYVEAMIDAGEINEMENLIEWLDEEWKIQTQLPIIQ